MPTLAKDRTILECVGSLRRQTWERVQVVVVDNSGCGRARALLGPEEKVRIIENKSNAGFGAAVNQGFRAAPADYLATLNDDAVADPQWVEAAVQALECEPAAGMAASRIALAGSDALDSAGMNIARDGSSRQRGHLEPLSHYSRQEEVLLPSGCAAFYRRAMIEETGAFEEDFFLYCEDTDLGLRARWSGWTCLYVPEARVVHRYSATAGRASLLKAYLAERNRLRLVVRCFPWSWALSSVFWAAARYFWHAVDLFSGHGKAAEFRQTGGSGWQLPWLVVRAHADLVLRLPRLLAQRRDIGRRRRMSGADFKRTLRRFSMPVKQVASW